MSAERIEILPEVVHEAMQPQTFKIAVKACRDLGCLETPGYDPNLSSVHRHCQKCGKTHYVVDWDHGWTVHRPVFDLDVIDEDGHWVWCAACIEGLE